MSLPSPSFGDLLRQLRSAASLSQEELAERAGLSVRGISDLERDLRQAPRLETVRLLADALDLTENDRAALLAAARPAMWREGRPKPASSPQVSLPAPLTRLIGRETELATLRALVQTDEVRLVTLTGAGGTGKTRLAVAVANGVSAAFPDGVVFVDLSPLGDPALVLPTTATALGVREVPGRRLLDVLTTYLASKQLLLLLDNCERILAATPDVTALLVGCPGVTIFATSREPLRVRGEHEVPLLPLPLPDSERLPTVEELARVPAIALFLERAAATQPDLVLTPHNAAVIAAICRRLDGLPLAIELAAARIRALPLPALLARLEHRLPLLTGGGRDLPARQRTMRDTIAWSYDLLAPPEQSLFRRVAVFAGGFTLAGAEAVAGAEGEGDVLDGVVTLIEHSLLRSSARTDDEPRYQMLETVREFGLERLTQAGELEDAGERHARHFLALAEGLLQRPLILMDQPTLTRIATELGNVRLALAWFDDHGEIDALLHLSSLLHGLWLGRGLYQEGFQWVERGLEQSKRIPSAALVQALERAGTLAIFQGDLARAEPVLAEALTLARSLGDPTLVGDALASSALLSHRQRDFARAEALLAERRAALGGGADEEHDVLPYFSHLTVGDLALAQCQFPRAARHYEEAIDRYRAVGNDWGVRDMQAGLAAVRYWTGDLPQAAALYWEGLERSHTMNYWPLLASSLLGLAAIAVASQQPEVGARLLGAAEGSAAALGTPIFTRDMAVREHVLTTLGAAHGAERLGAMRDAGRALPREAAIGEAKAVATAVTRATR